MTGVPASVKARNGPFDVVLTDGATAYGFITPAPADRQLISNTAPRIRLGGESGYADEGFDQLVLDGFETGQDQEFFDGESARAYWQDGNVALHKEGRVTLASQWETVDSSIVASARQILDFQTTNGDYIVLAQGTSLRIYDDGTGLWASEGGAFGADAKHLFANDQYLFVSLGSGVDARRWDGTKTTGWTTLTGFKADCFGWYQETLYRAVGNELWAATNNNGTAYAASAVNVGWDSTDIEDMWEAAGFLVLAKKEGLYIYDGTTVSLLVDAFTTRTAGNFVGGISWLGITYAPWLNAVYKIVLSPDGSSTVADVTPTMVGDDAKERYGHGSPWRLFAGPRRMYAATRGGEGVYPELLSYNGVGWHQVYRGTSGDVMRAAGYSRMKGWLLVADSGIQRKRIINSGDGEYADYATSGEFHTPIMDAGFPDEQKIFRSLRIKTRNCDADNTVTVKYKADDGAWTTAGTIETTGQTELMLAGLDGAVEANELQLSFTLTRDAADASQSPVIEMPMVVRVLVNPRATYAFTEELLVNERQELRNGWGVVGEEAGYTVDDLLYFLDSVTTAGGVIKRQDENGRLWRVKVTAKTERAERVAEEPDNRPLRVVMKYLDVETNLVRNALGRLRRATGESFSFETTEPTGNWLVDDDGYVLIDDLGNVLVEA